MSNLEKASHICVILASVLLSVVLFGKLMSTRSGTHAETAELVGQHLTALSDVRWHDSEGTLLLALSARCPHCINSARFYGRILSQLHGSRDIRVVALFPEGDDEARSFLERAGLKVSYVANAPYTEIGIEGTPTILQANSSGVVLREWRGELTSWEEKKMLAEVTGLRWKLSWFLEGLAPYFRFGKSGGSPGLAQKLGFY